MKKRNFLLLFCIAATLVYFFLVPTKVKQERYLTVDWRVTLTPENAFAGDLTGPDSRFTPLLLEDYLCYVSGEGDIGYAETRLQGAALGSEYFINYSSVPERLLIKGNDGTIIAAVDTRGYPVIEAERLFVLHQDRCGISEYSLDGELRWSKRYASMITSFCGSEAIAALGLLDGRLILLGSDGGNLHIETFQGGNYNTVYGCALDESRDMFAAVVGSGPQRFVVFEKIEGEYEVIASEVLESDFRRETYVDFIGTGLIVYEQEGALRVFDLEGTISSSVPVHGRGVEAYYDPESHLLYAVAVAEKGTIFTCYETTGRKIADYRFPGTVHLRARRGALFLTNGNSVFRITLREA